MSARALVMVLFVASVFAGCTQRPASVVFKLPGGGTISLPAPARSQAVTRTPLPETAPPKQTVAAPAPARVGPLPGSVVARRGDTVFAIARRFNVTVRGLIEANGLNPPYMLRVGQRVRMPRERLHLIERGETLYAISRRYGVDMSVLVRANGLTEPYQLIVGRYLRVPTVAKARHSGVSVATAKPAVPAPRRDSVIATPLPRERPAAALPSSPKAIPQPPPRSKTSFLWPVNGRVVSRFGVKAGGLHNDGINIRAPRGAAVRAAENGVVAYAGNELQGYGNLVLVRHSGGWTTAYAHNDSLLVERGEMVRRGQTIALVGATGSVSTPQAHFELRRGSRAVDPIKHLSRN